MQRSRRFLLNKHLSRKFGSLLRILQNGRHFDAASPINIVEALAECNFLKYALLDLGVRVNDFVMIRHSGPPVWLLTHEVEIVVGWDQALADQGSSRDIHCFAVVVDEESFVGFDVDHSQGEGHVGAWINFADILLGLFDEVFVVKANLVTSARILENEDLIWHAFVPVREGLDSIGQ